MTFHSISVGHDSIRLIIIYKVVKWNDLQMYCYQHQSCGHVDLCVHECVYEILVLDLTEG